MIVLASRSPRRRELLDQIGVQYRVLPVDVDERPLAEEPAEAYVRRITLAKAEAARTLEPGLPVLAADTAVVLDGRPLGKPRDRAHAVEMLLALAGRSHRVMSGVALTTGTGTDYRLSTSEVTFATLSREQALRYWETGEPADKAGGYAVQGRAALFIRHIAGSYSGIMGLPLFETGQLLAEAGLLAV
jgi:septum formation protein